MADPSPMSKLAGEVLIGLILVIVVALTAMGLAKVFMWLFL